MKLITIEMQVEDEFVDLVEADLQEAIQQIEFKQGLELQDFTSINIKEA